MYFKNFENIGVIFGFLLMFQGLSFLLCVLVAFIYQESIIPFMLPGLFFLVAGVLMSRFPVLRNQMNGNIPKIFAGILLAWFFLILSGTVPYLVSNTIPSFVNAVYESASGFTTTGSTVLEDVESLPKSILFWRSLTHWSGGLVSLFMLNFVLPAANIGGDKIFCAESLQLGRKPRHLSYILKQIILVYLGLTILQTFMLSLGEINLFNSMCYSFGAVSTGSFSPLKRSVQDCSAYVQYVMMFFMFLSGIGYFLYRFLMTGRLNILKRHEEVRVYVFVFAVVTLIISGLLYFEPKSSFEPAVRHGAFQVISFITTSGYSTVDYLSWPGTALFFLFLGLVIGGCSGSATGGVKMSRFLIFLRNSRMAFKNLVDQGAASKECEVRYDRKNITCQVNQSVLTYMILLGMITLAGIVLFSLIGVEMKKSAFLVISALTTFGHDLSVNQLPEMGRVILIVLMLVGRVGIYPLVAMFFWPFYTNDR